ncbi:unnamed protein product [Closterium sp. NIES-64]|nr:unnamed protein product [Closterium sp. NIES-64]
MPDNDPTGDDGDTHRTPDASQPQPSDEVAGDGNPGDENSGEDDDDTPEGRATQLNMYLSDDGEVLDLTGNQLKDLAGIPLPPTLTDLDLTTNRLAALDPRIGDLERLEKLSFRQNLITDAAAAGLKDLTRLTGEPEPSHFPLSPSFLSPPSPLSPLSFLSLLSSSLSSFSLPPRHSPRATPSIAPTPQQLVQRHVTQWCSSCEAASLNKIALPSPPLLPSLSSPQPQELVLRDNLLKKVPLVSPLTALSLLDLSYNHIHAMAPLAASALPALRELYLANNRIGHMEALEGFTQLRLLELGSNKIRLHLANNRIGHIEGLPQLRLLELGSNKIRLKVGRGGGASSRCSEVQQGCLDFGQAKEGRTHAVTKAGIGRKNEVYTENNSRARHVTRPRRGAEGDLWGVDLAEEIQIWEETIHMKIDGVRREGKIIEKKRGV